MTAPLSILSLAFLAGVALGLATDAMGWYGLAVALVALAGSAAILRGSRSRRAMGVLVPLVFALGLVHGEGGDPRLDEIALLDGQAVMLTGVVVADPLDAGAGEDIRVAVEQVGVGSESAEFPGEVRLRTEPGVRFSYGDRVRGVVTLRALRLGSRGSPFEVYLAERGISATGTLREAELLASGQGNQLRAWLSEARATIDRGLARSLDEPLVGLAQGIVTGKRDGLDRELRLDLNTAGVSHLVVISGSNVSLIAAIVVAVLGWLIGRRRAIFAALVIVAVYTAFVGADAPVVRAAIMATTMLVAASLGRRTSATAAITMAAALMVAVQPNVLSDLSFQLSFAATAGIALIATPARERLAPRLGLNGPATSGAQRIAGILSETSVVTVAAIAATTPLLALHFGQLSLVALPVNLLVTPIFTWIFVGSFLTGVMEAVVPGVADEFGLLVAWLPLSWFVEVAEVGAGLPLAASKIDGFGVVHALILFGALGGLAFQLQRPGRPRDPESGTPAWQEAEVPAAAAAFGVLAALSIVIWSAVFDPGRDTFDLHVLDVGQGDSIVARAPNGSTVLIDGGPDGRRLLSELTEALPRGQRRIDLMVATHPQLDHVAGLFTVFERFEVGSLLVSPTNDQTALGLRLTALAVASGTRIVVAEAGMRIDLGAGVILDVLGPLEGLSRSGAANPNNTAVVLRARHGGVAFLLASDLEAEAEILLARQGWELQSAVLKVAHHGSSTSTTDLLLRQVRPSLAVISAGARNTFGHPTDEVLARLSGVQVLRTDLDGTIILRSDGEVVRFSRER